MAAFSVQGMEALSNAFKSSTGMPDGTKKEMLTAMGEVAAAEVKKSGESYGIRNAESSQHILDKISLGKPKVKGDGGSVTITFKGTRTDAKHKTATRNAEIAFINEFGKKGQKARPFIKNAIDGKQDKIIDAGLEVFDKWLDSTFSD